MFENIKSFFKKPIAQPNYQKEWLIITGDDYGWNDFTLTFHATKYNLAKIIFLMSEEVNQVVVIVETIGLNIIEIRTKFPLNDRAKQAIQDWRPCGVVINYV